MSGDRGSPGIAPGTRLGDLLLERELGRGNQGLVYAAQQVSLGRKVAVKILPREITAGDEQLDRFHREVIAGQQPQPDDRGWTPGHRARLVELLDDVATTFEHSGRTGRAAYWAIDRQRLLHELMFWVDHDSELVVARGQRDELERYGHVRRRPQVEAPTPREAGTEIRVGPACPHPQGWPVGFRLQTERGRRKR